MNNHQAMPRCIDAIRLLLVSFLVCMFAPMQSCKMQVLKPSSDDSVREREARLKEENRTLKLDNEGLRARLAETEKELSPEEIELEEATPRLADVRIDSSSVVEPDPDGGYELVLRLDPSDDRSRFLQVVGSLVVRVVAVPEEGAPIPLAAVQFDPLEVREGWRGGVMGSSYVFDIPLANTSRALPPTVDVVSLFTDLRSGRTLRDERPVRVVRGDDR